MPENFDVQNALIAMEKRIREDMDCIREDIIQIGIRITTDAARAQSSADSCTLARTVLEGRVMGLEEKARWIAAAFGAGIVAMVGLIWRILAWK